MKQGTPLITTVPYVYEAFRRCINRCKRASGSASCSRLPSTQLTTTMTRQTSECASSCSYTPIPDDPAGVINASAYRAFVLTRAALDFRILDYRRIADETCASYSKRRTKTDPGITRRMARETSSITSTRASSSRHLQRSKPSPETLTCTQGDRTRGCILRAEPRSMRMELPETILPQTTSDGLPPRTLRLCRVHQSGRIAQGTLRRPGQHSEQIAEARLMAEA